ncbi:hypothetical protein ACKFKG_17720 [Phormidesmis sp. 146-35]
MSESHRYAIDPESLQGCRLRVLFHVKELQREQDPIVRANIAQYLAEASATLAFLEAEAARQVNL